MKLGIVGLPNVGKSTLFNAITKAGAESANYPFCTIDPNVGMVTVPDTRLDKLAEIYQPKKKTPAVIEFVDIAGLVKGASKGEGLGNKFLANIRETDAIVHVVRCFDNDNIIHVEGSCDPARDIAIIDLELVMADLEMVERRIDKDTKAGKGDKKFLHSAEVFKGLRDWLNEGKSARSYPCDEEPREILHTADLLTLKPVIFAANMDEEGFKHHDGNPYYQAVVQAAQTEEAQVIPICAKTGEGVETLRQTLYETALRGASPEEAYLTNERHIQAARTAAEAIGRALDALNTHTLDCAALDLRAAWEALGAITGENTTEDIVDRIFAKFCLGK